MLVIWKILRMYEMDDPPFLKCLTLVVIMVASIFLTLW